MRISKRESFDDTVPAMMHFPKPFFLMSLVICCVARPAANASNAIDGYRLGYEAVARSLESHGGLHEFQQAGGVTIETSGTFDLTARLQGRSPFRSEPTPIRERISVDLDGERVSYDVDWSNYKFSQQSLREVYDAKGRVLYIDRNAGSAGWPPFLAVPDAKERFKRFLPQFVLADALRNRATLRAMGEGRFNEQSVDVVGYVTSVGDHMTLYMDRETGQLLGASCVFDMELLGDTEIRWAWSGHRKAGTIELPTRMQVFLDGNLLKNVALDISLGVGADAFIPPEGIEAGDPPEVSGMTRFSDFTPYSRRPGQARELAPGVYLAPGVRPGFHMFFVEFDDFVVAVDAPTGWYEINQVPPFNFVRGEGTSALGEKYIRIINETIPDKPIRHVVLTHHHSDHIGGVREFIARGIGIIAAEPAAAAARRAARRAYTINPDALTGRSVEPKIEIVEGDKVISDGNMVVRLIGLPDGNPKAEGFLVVYLPEQKIMYLTSFLYPVPEDSFPVPESVPLSLWFVHWLDQSGLDVERIYNVHGQALVQDWQLEKFRKMLEEGAGTVAGESAE